MPAGRAGADGVVLRARRGVGSDVPGPWQGRRQARIAQRLHVGELEPEPCFLGVSGGFHHLAKKTKISTMWKPRTLRRSVGSRPTRGQRSACTSSPRRPRTARWKGAGPVYVVSIRIIHNTSGFPVYSSTLISIAGVFRQDPERKEKGTARPKTTMALPESKAAFEAMESLACPVCLDLPSGEVHQCLEGHCL